ncbi:chloride channel protein [Myxococcota bacterium]|nr:chloride channel protein [Myxococcota bacterium]MBU1510214.1 chloride channel protein [Myxococcota bacterium]
MKRFKFNQFHRYSQFLPTDAVKDVGRLLILSGLVGVVAGLGAIAFYYLLDLSKYFFLGTLAGYTPSGPGGEAPIFHSTGAEFHRWLLLVIPGLGGLISGIIVFHFAPEAEGHGTDAAIDSFHHKSGKVRARVPFIKAISSAITIGTGGSGGREGPIAQIGAGFGSILGGWLHLPPWERRILTAAGMAAGIGAIFHAPLAGALFAAEVLYRDMDLEYEVIIPAVIASIVAYSVFSVHHGFGHLFATPNFVFKNPAQLFPYLILAVVVAAGSIFYVKTFYAVQGFFQRMKIPNHFKPAIGGLIVGVMGFFLPEVLATGYGIVQSAFNGEVRLWIPGEVFTAWTAVGILVIVAVGKIFSTAFSIGSGGSGGVFGPAVVIGGAFGGATGIMAQQVFPNMGIQPGAFAMVGMAGFFAAAANTPISTIIMVSEMTGNYHLLVPSMWVCIIAYMLSRKHTIYKNQLASRFDAPIHMGNMMSSVLKKMTVGDVLDDGNPSPVMFVREDMPFKELIEKFSQAETQTFPVISKDGRLLGVVDGRLLRTMVTEMNIDSVVLAADIAEPSFTVSRNESLFFAIQLMVTERYTELLVAEEDDDEKIIAIITRNDIITAYNQEIIQDLELSNKAGD